MFRFCPKRLQIADLGDTILVVVMHADDAAMNMAGLIQRLVKLGRRIIVIVVTNSAGDNGNDLSETRRQEEIASWEFLGVTDVRFLGRPDGGVIHHKPQVTNELKDVILKERPGVLVTFHPDNGLTGHEDHREGASCAEEAVRQAEHPVLVLRIAITRRWKTKVAPALQHLAQAIYDGIPLPAVPSSRLAVSLRLSRRELRRKMKCILAHKSQIQPLLDQLEPVGGRKFLKRYWFRYEAFTASRPWQPPLR